MDGSVIYLKTELLPNLLEETSDTASRRGGSKAERREDGEMMRRRAGGEGLRDDAGLEIRHPANVYV